MNKTLNQLEASPEKKKRIPRLFFVKCLIFLINKDSYGKRQKLLLKLIPYIKSIDPRKKSNENINL